MLTKGALSFALLAVVGADTLCHAQGRKWAVVVGIGTYAHPKWNLPCPTGEANAVRKRLLGCGELVESPFGKPGTDNPGDSTRGELKCLIDHLATKANIQSVLTEWLPSHVRPEDAVLIVFGGHGARGPDLPPKDEHDGFDEYIVPYDAEPLGRTIDFSTAIRDDDFGAWVNNLKCRLVTVVFDSCYGGGAARTRSVGPLLKDIGDSDDFSEDLERGVRGKAVFVLSGCQAYERAWDGLFTPLFLEVFAEDRPDLSDRQHLEALKRVVSARSEGSQTIIVIDHAKTDEPRPLSEFFCCVPQRGRPEIAITLVPPYDETGGPGRDYDIEGRVSGVEDPTDLRVVVYAFTETYWYVQPDVANPFTAIGPDG